MPPMVRWRQAILGYALSCVLWSAAPSAASEATYEFTAVELVSSKPTFGLPAPAGQITGRFTFDPQTPADGTNPEPDCDCKGYRQHRPGGFTATFGDIDVRADEYVVELFNDLLQPGGQIADVVTIIASSDLAPPPATPLRINGIDQPSGQFIVSLLQYGGFQFDEPNLSELAGLENFGWGVALLGDTGHDASTADVFALLETVQAPQAAPADFDQDFDVDGNDLLIWQRTLGGDGASGGDANGNAVVDADDLQAWAAAFEVLPAQMATLVPEPSSTALAVASALLGAFTRRDSRGRRLRTCR